MIPGPLPHWTDHNNPARTEWLQFRLQLQLARVQLARQAVRRRTLRALQALQV
jgi:hypothetical protein